MEHDELCPGVSWTHPGHDTYGEVIRCGECMASEPCQCTLIARVRADERERAAGRVEVLPARPSPVSAEGKACPDCRANAVAAIREGGA